MYNLLSFMNIYVCKEMKRKTFLLDFISWSGGK